MEKEPRNDFYFLIEFGKLCILDTEYLYNKQGPR